MGKGITIQLNSNESITIFPDDVHPPIYQKAILTLANGRLSDTDVEIIPYVKARRDNGY